MYRYDELHPSAKSVGGMFIAMVLVVILPCVLVLLVKHLM
jgi:hypothetical protein